MAELTVLEDKRGEVIGLAMAAQGATDKIAGLNEDEQLARQLSKMHEDARETEERGTSFAEQLTARRQRSSKGSARPRLRPPR